MSDRPLRIGQVAELTGTTPRTIRYYEELGLLAPSSDREPGTHRVYEQADVDRLREVLRLRRVLGLSPCRVIMSARPAAVTVMPPAASVREPRLSAQSPASGEATSMPSAIGASFTPASIGSSPWAPW